MTAQMLGYASTQNDTARGPVHARSRAGSKHQRGVQHVLLSDALERVCGKFTHPIPLTQRLGVRACFHMPMHPEEPLLGAPDKPTELLVLKRVILCLRELSDVEQLRRSWFETGEVWLSFDVCRLFDDSAIAASLARGEVFGSSLDEPLRELSVRLSAYDPTHGPTLAQTRSAEWTEIARLAGALAGEMETLLASPERCPLT